MTDAAVLCDGEMPEPRRRVCLAVQVPALQSTVDGLNLLVQSETENHQPSIQGLRRQALRFMRTFVGTNSVHFSRHLFCLTGVRKLAWDDLVSLSYF